MIGRMEEEEIAIFRSEDVIQETNFYQIFQVIFNSIYQPILVTVGQNLFNKKTTYKQFQVYLILLESQYFTRK